MSLFEYTMIFGLRQVLFRSDSAVSLLCTRLLCHPGTPDGKISGRSQAQVFQRFRKITSRR